MVRREDGKKTRERLLNAVLEVFTESGYRNAKVADICRRAGANPAAVTTISATRPTGMPRSDHRHASDPQQQLGRYEIY